MIHLKKWIGLFVVTALLISCEEQTTINLIEPEIPLPKEQVPAVNEIIQQATKAMSSIKSFSSKTTKTQKVTAANSESHSSSTISMDMTQEPLAIYQQINMTLPEQGNVATTMYMIDNGIYFKDSVDETWFTYPEELTQDHINIKEMLMKPNEQLAFIQKHIEHFSLEERDEYYLITVQGSPDMSKEFVNDMASKMSNGLPAETVQEFEYSMQIEKETYFQTKVSIKLSFDTTMGNEPIQIHATTESAFAKFNEIDAITVPEAILEEAEEFSIDLTEFEEVDNIDLPEAEAESIEIENNEDK
ncbi:hypothetical protein GN156_05460 [bacterium LRH843]|nr:hypothetical protein [bacterium LRH843]